MSTTTSLDLDTLKRAVQRESEAAVMHWWGVGTDTVWKWRRALGVGRATTGTSALHARSLLGEHGERMRAGARPPVDDWVRAHPRFSSLCPFSRFSLRRRNWHASGVRPTPRAGQSPKRP